MKKIVLFLFMMFFATSLLYAAPEGSWEVKGTTSQGDSYSGTALISPNTYSPNNGYSHVIYGTYSYDSTGKKLASFYTYCSIQSNQIKFGFYIYKIPGIIGSLSGYGSNQKTPVYVTGTLSANTGKTTWKASGKNFSGKDNWKRLKKDIQIDSVSPAEVSNQTQQTLVFTISGKNFPDKGELKTSDIAFLKASQADSAIQVLSVLEVSDNGDELKIQASISPSATLGLRNIQVKEGVGKNLFKIISSGELKLPLGGSLSVFDGQTVKVYIPNIDGGSLKIEGMDVRTIYKGSLNGLSISRASQGTFEITSSGWYYFKSAPGVSSSATIKATYIISASVPSSRPAWHFWNFAFYDSSEPGKNLYDDNWTYDKLDSIFGNTPQYNGGNFFQKERHLDWYDQSNLVIQDYNANPGRYNPTTIKGFAWCYQRSMDSNKWWWGHCWGSVIAGSLFNQPKAAKVTANGRVYSFNEEESEGVLSAYFTDHGVYPTNYMSDCPAGPPTGNQNEYVDYYCDDFFLGLIYGLKQDRWPLAINVRAKSTDPARNGEVWNQLVRSFSAELTEVRSQKDETYIQVSLTIQTNDHHFPSPETKPVREEKYIFTLKFFSDGTVDRNNMAYQNWISATNFCPGYLWRINSSTTPTGTTNIYLQGKLNQLIQMFGYEYLK